MSGLPTRPQVEAAFPVVDALVAGTRERARVDGPLSPRPNRKRGATLRPGVDSPRWNALVQAVTPLLARHGEKARLGRLLGVPPQRIHEYFGARTAMPDAERTLLLIHWLSQRRAGLEPG